MGKRKSEKTIQELLTHAGIEINGNQPWDIQIHNNLFYKRVLSETALGLGESYMDGWWDCEALDEFIKRIVSADLVNRVKGNWKIMLHVLRYRLFNLQDRSRAYQVGQRHYDIGNDLYQVMLDKRLNYTCAYWKHAHTLDEAQEAKLELICKKINLKSGMSILDLGCGWGSFLNM